MPQTYTGKKAQLHVLFKKEQSVIIYLLCWKPALHFSLTTGSPILCLVLQVVYSTLFDNIVIRNKQITRSFLSFGFDLFQPASL